MKASVSPVAILIALAVSALAAISQDAVVLKDGQRREGQILGVRTDSIRFKVGPAETGIPLASVASVTMEPPKAYNDALAAWQAGKIDQTVSTLKPFVENFIGLPTKWAARASALLGEAYLAQNKIAEAEAAYAAFQKAYPDAAQLAEVGLARLAVAKKDFSTAREKLTPIVEAARKTKFPQSGENATFGQALFLMGEVQEASGQSSDALESYLLAVTVFREDQAVVAKAEERAKALQENKVIAP